MCRPIILFFLFIQVYTLCGRPIGSVSAGKYWTAAVTTTGDVYMWDAKKGKDEPPVATRLHGVKRATSVSVGETHLLIIGSLYHPLYPPSIVKNNQKIERKVYSDLDELDEDFMYNDVESEKILPPVEKDEIGSKPVPTLKSLCEKVAAENMVEPRNVLQLLEIADTLGADDLRKHCEVFFFSFPNKISENGRFLSSLKVNCNNWQGIHTIYLYMIKCAIHCMRCYMHF